MPIRAAILIDSLLVLGCLLGACSDDGRASGDEADTTDLAPDSAAEGEDDVPFDITDAVEELSPDVDPEMSNDVGDGDAAGDPGDEQAPDIDSGADVDADARDADARDADARDLPGDDADPDTADDPDGGDGDDLAALSDDFEVADEAAGWTIVNPEAASVTEADGVLTLEPVASTVWLDAQTALLVHRELSGDFRVTAYFEASDGSGQPVDGDWEYAGLMGRLADPNADGSVGEDYVFIALGHNTATTGIEGKVTDDGSSDWAQANVAAAGASFDRWLRLCRVGAEWRGYHRADDGVWIELSLSNGEAFFPALGRSDFADHTLSVGLFAYANNAADADLSVAVEGVTFARVAAMADCLTD